VFSGFYLFAHFDAYNSYHGGIVQDTWSYNAGYDHVSVTGDYLAGVAGFYPTGVAAEDHLSNKVQSIYYGTVEAIVDVAYQNGFARMTIDGPSEVIGWEGFTLNADLHDPDFVPPISYSWTQNGVNIGMYTDNFYYGGSPPDSNEDFTVTAVDLYGRTATETHHVRVKNCTQPGCMD